METSEIQLDQDSSVRWSDEADAPSIAQLAALDDAPVPTGPVLLAEVDGSLVAAHPSDGGRPFSDPFVPTRAIVEMLSRRMSQVRRPAPPLWAVVIRRGRAAHPTPVDS